MHHIEESVVNGAVRLLGAAAAQYYSDKLFPSDGGIGKSIAGLKRVLYLLHNYNKGANDRLQVQKVTVADRERFRANSFK